jgi:2-polyprenyl-3-methyl-5-hydroxy-6-metoxy-1,4-benzoquinol methylase
MDAEYSICRDNVKDLPKENIYGHINRLAWIKKYLDKHDVIMEVGCGTGYMITYPLKCFGYDIVGFDLDTKSVEYGSRAFYTNGNQFLYALDIGTVKKKYNVIIATEVFEHMAKDVMDRLVENIRARLNPGGTLLVTVPNGYGWFEVENFIWNKLHWGRLFEKLRIISIIAKVKRLLFGEYIDAFHPSTLSTSPHVRRFTFCGIQDKLVEKGFEIIEARGSVLFCGPFSHTFLTGIKPIMGLNMWLGRKMPKIAAAFYIASRKSDE